MKEVEENARGAVRRGFDVGAEREAGRPEPGIRCGRAVLALRRHGRGMSGRSRLVLDAMARLFGGKAAGLMYRICG